MYEQGKGVAQDQEEAVQWFRQAAEQGNMRHKTILAQFTKMEKALLRIYRRLPSGTKKPLCKAIKMHSLILV